MNKIEELLEKLCPNGVEYKKLEELVNIEKGTQLNRIKLFDNGLYPVINGGIKPSGYWNEYNYNENLITISQGGASAGYINYIETKFWAGAHCYVVTNITNEILYRYVYHYLKSQEIEIQKMKVGAGIPNLSLKDINKLIVPVPPLEIQSEIVRILDKFTELIALLKAELKARKLQYEYYREKILNFDDNNEVDYKLFGEIAKIQRGSSPRPIRYYITKEQNGINWIKIGDVEEGAKYITSTHEKITEEGAKNSRYIKRGSLILSNSMSFGRPYILAIDGCIHDGWLSISNFEQFYTTDFLYFLLNSNKIQDEFKKKANFGGAIHNLNADIVRNIILPIPTIKKQNEIVKILDKFYSLCNDLTAGIPAEIEARQKQYEYYRDKLLTFKELKNE